MRKAVIEFVDFGFQYRSQSEPTLHDINLTIYEGEKILIVGPSGSGKSTLAHCINGLVPFFYPGEMSGSLRIRGEDQSSLTIQRISEIVGTVLQDPDSQFVGLTVAEDIAFKLENDTVPQAEMIMRVAEAARVVGIHSHLGIAPHALSGGQKQRTTLAGVLVDQVDILLFDEPLANLDPLTGQRAIELIHQIHEQSSRTIIIIEHRLEDVLHREVDRIIVVNEGRIVADMAPDELLSTHILADTGIREPLYIAALRFAGCSITPEMKPQHVDTLVIDDLIDPLHTWYKDNEFQGQKAVNEPLLELCNVDFGYEEGKLILDNVSLSVNKGEMLSIVGKNGAGKSTISKLICGFYKPNAGSIRLNGNDMKSLTIKERSAFIGFVLQNPNQMISKPMLFDEVALGLTIRDIPEEQVRERVHQVLKVCGLYEFRHWPISALSFGQKKRVTIASILVLNPQIIILDEPTAGQDYRHYNEIMQFLIDLNQAGVTIVMITHDMHLMMEYTQRTYVLSDGQVIAFGTPTEILSDSLVVDAANLKGTSVLELAAKAGFVDPQEFVRRFTERDKEVRRR